MERQKTDEKAKLVIDASGLTFSEVNHRIRDAVSKGQEVTILKADNLYGVAAGLRQGEITIKGNVGDYAGLLNSGAKIIIDGNAGDFTGDNSWNGETIVKGDAGYGAGMYSYGGTLVIHGNAGNAVGQLLKGGVLVVNGSVGDHAGLYMVGGEMIIAGDAGTQLGDYIVRGAIYLKGECKALGHNTKFVKPLGEDQSRLGSLFERYGIDAKPEEFKKIVPVSKSPFT